MFITLAFAIGLLIGLVPYLLVRKGSHSEDQVFVERKPKPRSTNRPVIRKALIMSRHRRVAWQEVDE